MSELPELLRLRPELDAEDDGTGVVLREASCEAIGVAWGVSKSLRPFEALVRIPGAAPTVPVPTARVPMMRIRFTPPSMRS